MREKDIQLYQYFLKPGYIFLNSDPSIISAAIGSCVVVSMWDCSRKCGGAVNYSYPFIPDEKEATACYGNVALSCLTKMFLNERSNIRNIRAQIFGGASLRRSTECRKIATENIRIARSVLRRFKIKIISEDVGGNMGRKLVYNTLSNEAVVYKTEELRRSDWYPYEDDRR